MRSRFWAEVVGTAILVFCGTGAVVFHQMTGGAVTHVGIGLTFGLVVLAMIYTIGEVSGAHINPAVTIAFAAAGRFPWSEVFPYIAAQVLGAVIASTALWAVFPAKPHVIQVNPPGEPAVSLRLTAHNFGATRPWGKQKPSGIESRQAYFLEIALTFVLMFVVLSVSRGSKEKGITAGIVVGAVITFEAIFGGPISGASMNPARSLAPAVFAGDWHLLWIYLTAPVFGALLAIPTDRLVHVHSPSELVAGGDHVG